MTAQADKSSKFPCPFYLAYGTEDKIINNNGSEKFIEDYSKTHDKDASCTFKLDGFQAHELHKTTIKEQTIGSRMPPNSKGPLLFCRNSLKKKLLGSDPQERLKEKMT